jgi:hypothetical protein
MPDSHPNDYGQSGAGDITSQYLQIPGFFQFSGGPVSGPGPRAIDFGISSCFIGGGSQSDVTQVFHKLGRIPEFIHVQSVYTDGGRMAAFVYPDAGITSTYFFFFALDIFGGAHGPGNFGTVFRWMVAG